jgi:anti-anti-sigma factor
MGIQKWSENVILVELRDRDELQTAVQMVREKGDCEVVIDFSSVDLVGSRILSRLIELEMLLRDGGRKLILCSVSPAVKGVFVVARLDTLFTFAADKFAALANVQVMG